MQVWNVLHAARWKCRMQNIAKNRHLGTIAQICWAISSQLRHVSTTRKKSSNSNISSICPDNMVNFGPLAAEIDSVVWGTPANFNGVCVLAALLHGTLVVGVSQTLQRWTEGATYVWQGDHHVGHWPTFLVSFISGVVPSWNEIKNILKNFGMFHCFILTRNHGFIMVALWNRADHYIFALWFLLLSSSFFLA